MWMLSLVALSVAGTAPMVIRLDSAGREFSAPVVVSLSAGDQETEVGLADDGEAPDFAAGDGRWAGNTDLAGTDVELTLTVQGKVLGTTRVTLTAAEGPRDIDISLVGDVVAAVGSLPTSEPAAGAPVDGSAPPASRPSGVPPNGEPRSPVVSYPTQSSDNGLLFIGFGVGLFVLLGIAWLWMRLRGSKGGRGADVTIVPEPGLLGRGTPSLSDGLSTWIVPPDAGEAFLPALLTHLADRHRVLVVARSEVVVGPVVGGPVYRLNGVRPSLVGDVAESLAREPGAPVALLLVLEPSDIEVLRDYRDLLPADVGGVAILHADGEVPVTKVLVAPAGPGDWWVRAGDMTLRVAPTPRGLEVLGSA